MTRCDWRGPICTVDKDADRLAGWTLTTGAHTITLEAAAVTLGEDGHYRVDGQPVTLAERLTPIIAPGTEITVRRG